MQAPPFWTWMMRIAGIACLVTLLTPTIYLLKYALFDQPIEERIAETTSNTLSALSGPARIDGTEWYVKTAEGKDSSALRSLAVQRLGDLTENRRTLVSYPVECLHAKLAIEQVASADPDPEVRTFAKSTLLIVAEHGAVINR
jgi:hypothetical protein